MRYVVMEADEARNSGTDGVEPRGWDYDYPVLVDTVRNVVVYQDFDVSDAPEDMYLRRHLSIFVEELNRLAEERTS